MTDWETMLLACVAAFWLLMLGYWTLDKMKDMALTILECKGDISRLAREVAVLKVQLDSMAAREAESQRKEGRIL